MISSTKNRQVIQDGASAGGGITSLTGDVTATGPGAATATLSVTGVTAATYGDATHVAQFTVDAKGRLSFAANVAITPYSPPTYTQGSVLFAGVSGAPTQDNTNFFFNDTTDQLKVAGSILSPLIIGGTGTTDDLTLQATSGVGTTGSWIFFKVGNNGAITTMEMNHLGWVGIGTTGLVGLDCGLIVRTANPPDIGIVARFRSNLTAYVSVQSGVGANEHAGFNFSQTTNSVDWRMGVIGNDGDAQRWTVNISGTPTNVAYLTKTFNIIIDNARSDPGTGSKCLVFGDGTAPSSLASNTAILYADDVGGTVQLFGINEAGVATQITGVPVTATSSTGTVSNLAISGAQILYLDNATDITLTGIVAGIDGQRILICSRGAGNCYLIHQATSTAANQFFNDVTSGPTPLAAGLGTALYEYDASISRWKLVFHNQGAFIDIPFGSCTYDSNTGAFWTVASGDVTVQRYLIVNKAILFNVAISGTTTTAGVGARLRITFTGYQSWTFTATTRSWARVVDGGAAQTGMMTCGAGSVSILQFSTNVADTAWGTGAGRNIDAATVWTGLT